jgi:hypothetical protein
MLATVPTTNVGGDHGHIGMILDDAEYTSFSTGATSFVAPKNPGPFPTTVSTNKVDRLRQLAEHKQLIIEYETYQGCLQATRTKIIQAIDPKWLEGFRSKRLGFTHRTPIELLNHLRSNGATLDDTNIQELISTMDKAWNPTKNPASSVTLLGTASTPSMTSHQPHIWSNTSMLHSVFPPKHITRSNLQWQSYHNSWTHFSQRHETFSRIR